MGDNYKDLEELARSTTEDYYELLAVPFDTEESVIKRAYRKASIRYHPDKNPDNKDAADRFIALGWARDILIDPKLKGEYDRARTRRREKAFQDELLSGNRRKMKEELERRERESADFGASLKRKRAADMSEAEEGAGDSALGRGREEEAEGGAGKEGQGAPGQSAELDRTVKIRFHREGETATWDKDAVRSKFEKYGKIDSIIMGKDKKLKLEGEKHRKLVAMVFSFKASFGSSLGAGNGATPLGTPKFSFSPKTPSLEEVTMMRLKNAEKKRLEEQIRKKEAAEAAREAA
ncbi:hypothetical protein N0V86_008041 [Didymella sp. IMI 355093]|nr:hypothetical protein N0V86_008041 [Didymella sp. IMI 355093]